MTTQKPNQYVEPFKHFKSIQGKEFDAALKLLHDYAYEHGLSEEDLQIVTDICLTPKIAMFRLKILLQSLIPVTYVPASTIRKALMWLLIQRNTKFVLSTKFVLQWLSGLVEYNLDQTNVIDKYYDFFYHYLEEKRVNVYASKLIYLLTKPSDVSRWYVTQVLRIYEMQNRPKHISALLYLFKMYRPDCVPENIQAHAVHTLFGTLPQRLIHGFTRARDNIAQNSSIHQKRDNILWIQLDQRQGKKNAVQLIPSIAQNETSLNVYQDGSKSLLSITNASDLHKYHLSMSSPGRAMALLNSSVGYHLLTFCDTNVHARFSWQLYYTLHDAFLEANQLVSKDEKINLLKRLSFLQIHMQQSIPVVSKFLAEYIIRWDGHQYEPHIYRLLRWLHIVSFAELRDCILNFLYTIFISDTVETKCKILGLLGDIASNMILTYANRVSKKRSGLFLNIEQVWTLDDIKKLYEYIHSICNIGLHITKGHSMFIGSIINLHYKIMQAETISDIKLFRISNDTLYYALFSTNPSLLIQACNLINKYPQYMLKDVQPNFLDVLWYNKALPLNSGNESVNELEIVFKNFKIAEALEWRQHFGLACYNVKILEKVNSSDDFENFIKYAHSQYPSVCEFLGRNV